MVLAKEPNQQSSMVEALEKDTAALRGDTNKIVNGEGEMMDFEGELHKLLKKALDNADVITDIMGKEGKKVLEQARRVSKEYERKDEL